MRLPTTDDATLRTSDTAPEMWEHLDDDPTEARRRYPSGWLWLTGESAVRKLLDAALDRDPDGRYGVRDLAGGTGLDDAAVERGVDALVELGVLVADDGAYLVDEHGIVRHAASELAAAVEATGVPDDEPGLEYLGQYESVRLMVDALLDADPDQELEQADVHRLTGVSRKRVWHHVETLIALGVLVESGEAYRVVRDSDVLGRVRALDAAVVGATLSTATP